MTDDGDNISHNKIVVYVGQFNLIDCKGGIYQFRSEFCCEMLVTVNYYFIIMFHINLSVLCMFRLG